MNWYKKSQQYEPLSPEQMNKNIDDFMSTQQQRDKDSENFAVDLRSKQVTIDASTRKAINANIHDLGNYHVEIPLREIFDIMAEYNVIALQEDGTPWSGLLIGGAECGSDEANDQYVNLQLAYNPYPEIDMPNPFGGRMGLPNTNAGYKLTKQFLFLAWCKMHSGKYEIVSYIS